MENSLDYGQDNRLSEAKLFEYLKQYGCDINVALFNEIDSTNNEARRIAINGFDKSTIIVAEGQTEGRGRLGRSFYSPNGTGVYFTYLYQPSMSVADSLYITSATAVAVVRVIRKMTNLNPMIKWVNDVYIGNRKICGILAESFLDKSGNKSIAIGIGVNINTKDFPPELMKKAGSLNINNFDRNRFISMVVKEMMDLSGGENGNDFMEEYREYSLVLNKEITYIKSGKEYNATVINIDDNGGLVVKNVDGEISVLNSGEISLNLV